MMRCNLEKTIGVWLCASILALVGCSGHRMIISPADNGVAIGDTVKFIVHSKCAQDFKTYLDDTQIYPEWEAEAYSHRWISDVRLPNKGPHPLRLEGECEQNPVNRTIRFRNDLSGSISSPCFIPVPFNSVDHLALIDGADTKDLMDMGFVVLFAVF